MFSKLFGQLVATEDSVAREAFAITSLEKGRAGLGLWSFVIGFYFACSRGESPASKL